MRVHIDLETYSSVNLLTSGAYKYTESEDFEILILCYKVNKGPVITVDLASGVPMPPEFSDMLLNPDYELHAQGAVFERLCFRAIGYDIPIWRWHCTAIKAAACGYPHSLAGISEAMDLGEQGKLSTGKALIRYFSVPIKPTKANGMRKRNFPRHDPEKWAEYKRYCEMDVVAESTIYGKLAHYETLESERQLYILDQEINDRGILIDVNMAKNAMIINKVAASKMLNTLGELTGLDNPNSPAQLKKWLSEAMQKDITSLAKKNIIELVSEVESGVVYDNSSSVGDMGVDGYNWPKVDPSNKDSFKFFGVDLEPKVQASNEEVLKVLQLRQKSAKTSIKKYLAMVLCACYDGRAHGLFQFLGASRTGRWAGRLIQMQNLPQNHLDWLELARHAVATGDYELLDILTDDISSVLSQLIRTTFIAKPGHTFAVADFSAIEARVLAWLAGELWRLEVFATHGKIYEASAAMMFKVPLESIKKGSPERQKGKIAELALGYGGAIGALLQMGGEAMGLSTTEMNDIVADWREVNPQTVKLWAAINSAAIRTIKTGKKIVLDEFKNLIFEYDGKCMTIQLPSGRKLYYQDAMLVTNKWGRPGVRYKGLDQKSKKWWWVDTYGGKLTENIVQAIARDCLAFAMLNLNEGGYEIVLHVHDEAVAEVPIKGAEGVLNYMCDIMGQPIPWAPGLRVPAEGYITRFYKKD